MVVVEFFWLVLSTSASWRIRIHIFKYKWYTNFLGGLCEVVRPDPIPNSVVKHFSGDDNISARLCENTSLPGLYFCDIVKSMKSAQNKGFTLVELLVVISIIAILSVIGMTVFSGVQKNARDARRKGDLHAIALALEQYKVNNGSYPLRCEGGWANSTMGNLWLPELTSNYLQQPQPVDPINIYVGGDRNRTFIYVYYSCDSNGFVLGAHLENPNDPSVNSNFNGPLWGNWFINYIVRNQQ